MNIEKRVKLKERLLQTGVGIAVLLGLSSFVSAGMIQKYGGLNYLLNPNTPQNIGSITRTSDLVSSVLIAGRTITINRDVSDNVTGWEDANYETILTRNGDNIITNWSVNIK